MPTLDWIGKDKIVNHHADVPYCVLDRRYSFDDSGQHEEDNGSENMIIHGDNLYALKSLLPKYEGKVDLIYIDPPYNTGNEGWVYNDNMKDPQFQRWFGEVVKKEGEDLSRHDKWLCMMYPRIVLLRRLLSDDGVIFVSISDVELYLLKIMMDSIFGINCFVSKITWENNHSPRNDSDGIPYATDNLLVYGKKPKWSPNELKRTLEMEDRYDNIDGDSEEWTSSPVHAPEAKKHRGMVYAIQHPMTGELMYPPSGRHWTYGQNGMLEILNEWSDYEIRLLDDADVRAEICLCDADSVPDVGALMLKCSLEESQIKAQARFEKGSWPAIYFTKKGKGGMRLKTYVGESGKVVTTLWTHDDAGTNSDAKNEIKGIFDGKAVFDTPKPKRLLDMVVSIATEPDSIILDSFAGSATTAHAVLAKNAEDGGTRRFIMVETMDYADTLTAERVKRVIRGYKTQRQSEIQLFSKKLDCRTEAGDITTLKDAWDAYRIAKDSDMYSSVSKPKMVDGELRVIAKVEKEAEVNGIPGDFSFYELGEPLLTDDGLLNGRIPLESIREYIYYTETGQTYVRPDSGIGSYLGTHAGVSYFFIYDPEGPTKLDYDFVQYIQGKADASVVYADVCLLDDRALAENSITFRKIPRDIMRL